MEFHFELLSGIVHDAAMQHHAWKCEKDYEKAIILGKNFKMKSIGISFKYEK